MPLLLLDIDSRNRFLSSSDHVNITFHLFANDYEKCYRLRSRALMLCQASAAVFVFLQSQRRALLDGQSDYDMELMP